MVYRRRKIKELPPLNTFSFFLFSDLYGERCDVTCVCNKFCHADVPKVWIQARGIYSWLLWQILPRRLEGMQTCLLS